MKEGDRVLEFGGGVGNNLIAVAKRADVVMVEPSGIGRETAASHGIRAIATLDDLGEDQLFDTILCRHVLEHVPDPVQVLGGLAKRLAPGGLLVLCVPVENPRAMPVANDLDHHLFGWNPRNMRNLLEHCGWRHIQVGLEHYGARRRLLPLFRWFGGRCYARWVRRVGWWCRFAEVKATARRGEI